MDSSGSTWNTAIAELTRWRSSGQIVRSWHRYPSGIFNIVSVPLHSHIEKIITELYLKDWTHCCGRWCQSWWGIRHSLVVLRSSGCQCWCSRLGLLYLAGTRHSPASGGTRSSQAVLLFHIYVLFKVPSTLCMGFTSKRTLQGQSHLNGWRGTLRVLAYCSAGVSSSAIILDVLYQPPIL